MYLVYDVGGTFIKFAVVDKEGNFHHRGETPTPYGEAGGVTNFVEILGKTYDDCKAQFEIEGIAISIPGQIDVEKGIVYGGGSLKYTHNAHIGELVSKRCDGLRVALENDGKCAALAEVWLGNAKDCKDACILVLGTGIGGGIVIDRHVLHGNRLMAGELSFAYADMKREELCKIKPLEEMETLEESYRDMPYIWSTACSTKALTVHVAMAKGMDIAKTNGKQVYELVEAGDEEVIRIVEDWYFNLAKFCCNMYMSFDPDVILIGGGISAQPAVLKGIQKYVDILSKVSQVYRGIRIDVCKYRNDSNIFGALYNFMQMYEE